MTSSTIIMDHTIPNLESDNMFNVCIILNLLVITLNLLVLRNEIHTLLSFLKETYLKY